MRHNACVLNLFVAVLLLTSHDSNSLSGNNIAVDAQLLLPDPHLIPLEYQPPQEQGHGQQPHQQKQNHEGFKLQQDSSFSLEENVFDNDDSKDTNNLKAILEEQGRIALETPSQFSLSEPQLIGTTSTPANSTWRLWYRTPAKSLEHDGFLIGNGRNQVLIGGHINVERLALSEESCWSGGPGSNQKPDDDDDDGDDGENQFQYRGGNVAEEKAQEQQQALKDFKVALDEKRKIYPLSPIVKPLHGDERGFGRPEPFGEILVEELRAFGRVQHYIRELDLESGVVKVSFTVDDVEYTREHFCSYPDSICVMRIAASQPKSISVKVSLNSHHLQNIEYLNFHNRLGFRSQLTSNNMTIEAQVSVKAEGGTGVTMSNKRQVVALGFNTVTLYYSIGTDWSASNFPIFQGKDPHDRLVGAVDKAATMFYGDQFQKHVQDHQSLYRGFQLNLGKIENPRATNELLDASRKGRAGDEENYLDALLVHYSRYLLIASSRPGALPLSGQTAWSAAPDSNEDVPSNGFKLNINLQMNYWLAESTALGETVFPLIDYIENLLLPRGQDTAMLHYGARGWTVNAYSNIWAHTGPTSQEKSFYFPAANAWLCQHAWDRYLYGQDSGFLKDHAYKLMKGASQFWLDTLAQSGGGGGDDEILLTSPSYSPEHGPFTKGSALDQQLITQLFNNTLEATVIVGEKDKVFIQNLTTTLAKLSPGLKIGSLRGQLQEWDMDLDEPGEQHYHMAPFWAVYPGSQIFSDTPKESTNATREELLEAARTALLNRGTGVVGGNLGWAKSWRTAVWARLGNERKAMASLELFKKHNLKNYNLLDFEEGLSGQLGISAAIVEMLVQSRSLGSVEILIGGDDDEGGLPGRWLNKGAIQGFRTREGHSVSISWEDAKVRNVEILAAVKAAVIKIRIRSLKGEEETPSEKVHVTIKGSNKVPVFSRIGDIVLLTMSKGQTYVIQIDA
ncbi:hypothetical protein BGZ46_010640 [Entomortierella lignicola]|nr:hypothetical protein BGZ46_010640 [Entomortierella lignicola]